MKSTYKYILILSIVCLIHSCQKDYSLEGVGLLKVRGTWNFSENGNVFDGNIDTAFIHSRNGTKILHLQGPSLIGNQRFNLDLYTTDSFHTGTYLGSASQVDLSLANISKTLYQSDPLAGEFTVTINDISNNAITGVFFGSAYDSNGVVKNITSGNFSSTIDLSNNTTTSSSSVGTLGSTSGQCTPVTISGTYTQNTALTSSNTVQIQVNVTTPGTFVISTNSINGVSFSQSGTFSTTGIQNITLNGTGTPATSGTKTFTLTYGSSTCNFDVMFN